MKSREEELVDLIEGLDHSIMTHRSHIRHLRDELTDEESKLIKDQLDSKTLKEELRLLLSRKVKVEPTEREVEIAEFKKRAPAILESLEGKKLRE